MASIHSGASGNASRPPEDVLDQCKQKLQYQPDGSYCVLASTHHEDHEGWVMMKDTKQKAKRFLLCQIKESGVGECVDFLSKSLHDPTAVPKHL